MGDKPLNDGTEPSLELHLFGRKKKPAAPVEEPAVAVEPDPEPTVVLDEPAPAPAEVGEAPRAPKPPKVKQPKAKKTTVEEEWDEAREFKLPSIPGRLAAIITGAFVGAFGAVLTWGSLRACESFKGTDSCGGQGFFLLLVVLVLMILAGGALLAAWDVADSRSTSALGVGIVCVLILLLLIQNLFDGWMFLIVPVVSAVAYAAAHWVTTSLVDEKELAPDTEQHDVR
jgi:hypothetical protein